jgi:hypothetical protein
MITERGRQAILRMQNSISELNGDGARRSYLIDDLARMYVNAELLLSAIATLYNELWEGNVKAGTVGVRIDPGKLVPKP